MRSDYLRRSILGLAIPVTLQAMLQSSFSLIDQIMIGQLGTAEVAAVGLAGKFVSLLTVLLGAVAGVSGIVLAQAVGAEDQEAKCRGFYDGLLPALALAMLFVVLCLTVPETIMSLYTKDQDTIRLAADYLRYLSLGFLPMAASLLLSTLLRCMQKADLPFYAGIAMAVLNTGLNFLLIFGRLGLPTMGVAGAALATAVSQMANCLILWYLLLRCGGVPAWVVPRRNPMFYFILLPMLATEFAWSLGENVYGMIYGHLGTAPCAAMTLLNPVQALVIGALSGLSQAASILVGKELGSSDRHRAELTSKVVLRHGLVGSAILSLLLLVIGKTYLSFYAVEQTVHLLAWQILGVYAAISPVKVQNMILGGILRSGGKTRLVMWIDLCGTWIFGVPLGVLAAFVWRLSIPWVYLLLSLEECVRLLIGVIVFRRGSWMQKL